MSQSQSGMSRRTFLHGASAVVAATPFALAGWGHAFSAQVAHWKEGAKVRAVFLYPPSKAFADNPNSWWSWPGNQYDAECHEKQYTAVLKDIEKKLGMTIDVDSQPIASTSDAERVAGEIEADKPDGLLIVMFYNLSLGHADLLLKAAGKAGIPVVFYIGLGVKHGQVSQYRIPGVYFIQSLDNFEAIEYGMRMINARKLLSQSRLLSITKAERISETEEQFLGLKVRTVPSSKYADEFHRTAIGAEAKKLLESFAKGAKEIRVTQEALENAARAHLVLKKMLVQHDADGVTMNCLREGMLKPCVSFALFNSQLTPAACENDLGAAYTLFLGEALTGRAGFQHNPAYETERNHYYASHCTCAPRLHGPDQAASPYILRKFFHSNEGSCAIQAFWKEGEPVTMVKYYTGQPAILDVYAGKVWKSHKMPPAGGCATNVEIEITDRADACMVKGHHNVLFCGDFARKFRVFANLYKMNLA
ncbi:MAG TPA: hypothetical protein VFI02_00305 [Armatimonadota bacterium]|nr:hypothetical protein [Armatimonadota bacterium]